MDYFRHYEKLIARADERELIGYSEKHHVIPRCMDPESDYTVRLTPEEHYVAHQLLVKMFPGNVLLVFAVISMTMSSPSTSLRGNKLYGWLRRAHSKAMSKRLKGRKWSEKERIAHGVQWNKGLELVPLSDEQKAYLSEIHLNRYKNKPELASNHSAAMKRHYEKPGTKEATSIANKKYAETHDRPKPSIEQIARQSASLRKYYENPENRKRQADASKTVAAKRKEADALLTPEQKLQRRISKLEDRISNLEKQASAKEFEITTDSTSQKDLVH